MPEDMPPPGLTPTNYQRTTGGNLQWKPPTPEHLAAMLPQYEIECLLGHGGMGAVYKGRQKSLDRAVAIKILPPEAAGDAEAQFVERFKNEARTMAKMNHPAIVHVYDFGEIEGRALAPASAVSGDSRRMEDHPPHHQMLYIVMEFIDGTDVSKMILSQGRLPADHALAITAHVCDALQYAHTHGVIHRDIKPANIMLNMEGAVKVADFGLAKANDPSQSGLTKTNMAMGTPDFVAPEALISGALVDGRADLYAVGVMLYQMLTGNIPRGMWTMPSKMVGTDPRFDGIIARAMQTDPAERYQTAAELRRDLDVILSIPMAKEGAQHVSVAMKKKSAAGNAGQRPAPSPGGSPAPGGGGPQARAPRKDAAPAQNHQSQIVNHKSKAPLVIGIGAAAALALGAFFLRGGSRQTADESPQASTTPADHALAGAATSGAVKVREEPKLANTTPAPAPTPAASSAARTSTPSPPSPASSLTIPPGWTDLMASADVASGALKGTWAKTAEGLSCEQSGSMCYFQLNHAPPEEYDFQIDFTPLKGAGRNETAGLVSQMITVPGHQFALVHLRAGSFLGANLDGKQTNDPARTEGLVRDVSFENGRRIQSRVEVRRGSVRVLIDDKEVMNWSGDFKRMELHTRSYGQPDKTRLAVACQNAGIVFHRLMIRPAGAPPPAPTPGAINLLAGLDVAKNTLSGDWRLVNGELLSNTMIDDSEIALPYSNPPAQYDLHVRLTRRSGFATSVNFGSNTMRTAFRTDGWTGNQANKQERFVCWHGVGADQIKMPAPLLLDGKPHDLVIQVRDSHLAALVDGNVVIRRESGLASAVALPANNATSAFGIKISRGETIVHAVELIPVSDAAAPAATVAMPAPAVANSKSEISNLKSSAPADPRLTQLAAGFKTRHDTDAQQPALTAINALNKSYVANGIARARAAAQSKGSLAEVTALDAEKAAIEKGEGVPAEDAPDTPDSLKTLRATYRTALAKITAERDAKAAPLYDLYVKALDAYIAELTQANKIDQAQQVKTVRDDISTQKNAITANAATGRAAGPPAAADRPQTAAGGPSSPSKPGTPVPAPAGGSAWRRAAEQIVALGGSGVVMKSGQRIEFKTEKDIPSGKFELIEISLDRLNSVLPPFQDKDFQPFIGLRDLQRVWIRPNAPGLTDAAFAFLAGNDKLDHLNLEGVGDVTDAVLTHLATAKKLTTLQIQYAKGFTGKGLEKMPFLKSLLHVDFLLSGVTDEGLKALAASTQLLDLRVNGATTTDSGFAQLRGLKSLTSLGVTRSGFGDEAAAVFAGCTTLRELDLANTKLTDKGLEHLKALKNLTSLSVSGTAVTLEAATAFQKALPQCRVSR